MDNTLTLNELIEQAKLAIQVRDDSSQTASAATRQLRRFVADSLVKMGIYDCVWTVIESNDHSYSYKKVYLVLTDQKMVKRIKTYLKDIPYSDYLPLGNGATLQCNPSEYSSNPTIKFDACDKNSNIKKFVRENHIKIHNLNVEQEIERLKQLQRELP